MVWIGSATAGRRIVGVITNIILARMLVPADFGLVAMATVFTGFLQLLNEAGLGPAIVQGKEIDERHLSSVFWLNVAISSGIGLAVFFGAGLIADFFGEADVEEILQALSISFSLSALGQVQRAVLKRALDFRRLAIAQIIGVVVGGVVAIVMAAQGFGVWSIIARTLVEEAVVTVCLWVLARWRPHFIFNWQLTKPLVVFGAYLMLTGTLAYVSRSADNVLVGKYLGAEALGIYSRAYVLMLVPMLTVSRLVATVLFPVLSSIQDDKKRIKEITLRAIGGISLLTFPVIFGVLATAESFVHVLLGEGWSELVPVLRILCPIGFWQAFQTVMVIVYTSQGKTRRHFWVDLSGRVPMIVGIVVGLRWGIEGVAWGYAIASAFHSLLHQHFGGRLVGLGPLDILRRVRGVFGAAIVMGAIVFGVGYLLRDASHPVRLSVMVSVGVASYFGMLVVTKPLAFVEVRAAILQRRKRKAKK